MTVRDRFDADFPTSTLLISHVVRMNTRNVIAIAIYDYDAEDDLHLTFRKKDITKDIKFWKGDSWKGKTSGKIGFFVGQLASSIRQRN